MKLLSTASTACLSLMGMMMSACNANLPVAGDNQPYIEAVMGAHVDSEVVVQGENFPPEAVVNLSLAQADAEDSAQPVDTALTDEQGSFTVTFPLPTEWSDGDPAEGEALIITATDEDTAEATSSLTLESDEETQAPTLTLYPEYGQPGDAIRISGEGFMPNAAIMLYLVVPQSGLNHGELLPVITDENGRIKAELQIPLRWPRSDVAIIEHSLLIAAVDKEAGEVLATAPFVNTAEYLPVTIEADE